MTVVKDIQGSGPGKQSRRADILGEQGQPNFGVTGEDGTVNGNGGFHLWRMPESLIMESGLISLIDEDQILR